MKKYSKLLAIPAALWALSLSLALPAGGCNRSTPGSEPIVTGTDESAHTKNITPAVTPGEGQSGTQTPGEADKDVAATATPEATLTPTATPEPTEAPTPTPITVNTDTSTITYLVNREYPLPEGFVPEGLTTPDVLFPFADTSIDKAKMTPEAGEALALLFDAAYDEAKLTLYGVSAYRSYARQYTIYATNLVTQGIAHTNRYSAAPGRSEHQTGLAIDISCASEGFGLETTFADTPEGIWVAENAHRFGFILRYPKDKEDITGYNYEPWHIRYVGTELAGYLYETGLTLDEYYGVPSALSAEYLETTPLIDTTAESYLAIYRQYH
ncbi:MAG: D-alanyl-D-alanine carboxypeptidase family protein [Lachnospiraceae bacterium]|nr:D-alanyl-D-alanine carboxypeptidase family protein [Lachnospiraceae bacterium]